MLYYLLIYMSKDNVNSEILMKVKELNLKLTSLKKGDEEYQKISNEIQKLREIYSKNQIALKTYYNITNQTTAKKTEKETIGDKEKPSSAVQRLKLVKSHLSSKTPKGAYRA